MTHLGTNLPLILLSVLINAGAQLLMKHAMVTLGPFEMTPTYIGNFIWSFVTNAYVFSTVFCYAVSLVMWMVVLSRVPVSLAYPCLSIGYIVVALAGYWLFNEDLSLTRILGILVIILGVFLLMWGRE